MKEKFNKKKLLTLVVLGIFTLALVNSAGLMLYYGQVTANIEVTQPISITGNLEQIITDARAGQTMLGEMVVIQNNDIYESIPIKVSSDAPDGIDVIYEYATYLMDETVVEGWQISEDEIITIIVPADGFARLDFSYRLDSMLETGTYTITTTIEPERDLNETYLCIAVFDPVCGVDGITYTNSCWAWVANVEIDCEGMCPC